LSSAGKNLELTSICNDVSDLLIRLKHSDSLLQRTEIDHGDGAGLTAAGYITPRLADSD
jgi:hypothetical protein